MVKFTLTLQWNLPKTYESQSKRFPKNLHSHPKWGSNAFRLLASDLKVGTLRWNLWKPIICIICLGSGFRFVVACVRVCMPCLNLSFWVPRWHVSYTILLSDLPLMLTVMLSVTFSRRPNADADWQERISFSCLVALKKACAFTVVPRRRTIVLVRTSACSVDCGCSRLPLSRFNSCTGIADS